MRKIELLAPAGNLDSFNCAINSGADAIYLGLNSFNARGNIENFDYQSLQECVRRAHLFGVRVFLTLNTLILDDEIEDVLNLVRKALEIKVDAFIVQDIGLCFLLREKFPEIELHASTQMGVSNLEGATFLKDLGFKRIVLARETPLNEIKRISDNLDIELEYFVQGALCVSYSGNCYLCSLYANASGNRGKCKQFCRLPVKMQSSKGKREGYLLSTKDFCMLPRLKDLIEAGVTSLKIEGRARRPAYVAGAVKVYRDAIDNGFNYNENSINILKRLFNRGDYISGYFNNENIIYNKTQNHIGVQIGEVLSFKRGKRFNEVLISSNHDIKKGDALKFFEDEKEVGSLSVQDVKGAGKNSYMITTANIVPAKAKVRLIVDKAIEEDLLSLKRKVQVEGFFEAKVGKRAKLTLKSGDNEICEYSEEKLSEAKEFPLTEEECLNQISKMGDDFKLVNLSQNLEKVFMAKSQINKLRRNAIEKLKEKIIQKNQPKNIEEKEIKVLNKSIKNIKINKKIIYFSSFENLEKYVNSDNYLVFNPDNYSPEEIREICQKYNNKIIYLALPVIAEEKDIKLIKNIIENNSNLGIVANNYYALNLVSIDKVIIGSEMNIANSYAVEFYKRKGFSKIILTKENFPLQSINNEGVELFIESDVKKSLMHFKHCPFKENLGGSCQNCQFDKHATYILGNNQFEIKRKRLTSCQFVLKEKEKSFNHSLSFGEVVEI